MHNIFKEQNKEEILLLQYLQRKSYDSAEKLNWSSWIPTLISECYLVYAYFNGGDLVLRTIALIFGCLSLFITWKYNKHIKIGSSAKAYIDSILFKIELKDDSINYSHEKLNELAITRKNKNEEDYIEQVENTGEDDVPGLRDWYTPRKQGSHQEHVFACQKDNLWWNKNLSRKFIIVVSIVFTTIFLAVFIAGELAGVTTIDKVLLLFFSLSLWSKIFNEFKEFFAYEKAHILADKVVEMIDENGVSEEMIVALQSEINKVRRSGFIVPNYFHKINSVRLHKLLREKIRVAELNSKNE